MYNKVDKLKESLKRKKQILYSWEWFYSNSDLAVNRYPKVNRTIVDRNTKESKTVSVNPHVNDIINNYYGNSIDYSLRFKEDKIKILSIIKEIRINQLELRELEQNHSSL